MRFYTREKSKKSIFKVFAIYYICMAVFCVLRICTSAFDIVPNGVFGDVLYTFIIQGVILFLLPFLQAEFCAVSETQE